MRTVAITGTHPATRGNAPFDDPSIDIWVFNEAATMDWAKRVTGVFQMHKPDIYRSSANRNDPRHWEWLQSEHGYPVYMQERDPDVPNSVRYPLEAILEDLHAEPYFTSSIAYALALAGYLEYDRVLLYGVEMTSNTEYYYQRTGIAYWIGILTGRGVEVIRHCADGLLDAPRYGYDGGYAQDVTALEARETELESASREWRGRLDEHKATADNLGTEAISAWADAASQAGHIDGALRETRRYLYKCLEMAKNSETPYLDRNELESAAAAGRNEAEDAAAHIHRTAGRLDYALLAYQQAGEAARSTAWQAATEHIKAAYDHGKFWGIYEENDRLAGALDDNIRAMGGEKALEIMTAP